MTTALTTTPPEWAVRSMLLAAEWGYERPLTAEEKRILSSEKEAIELAEMIAHEVAPEFAKLEATVKELEAENEFLRDMLCGFEWQRINSMHIDEVKKELLEAGYTEEKLEASFAKVRALIEAAKAKLPTTP